MKVVDCRTPGKARERRPDSLDRAAQHSGHKELLAHRALAQGLQVEARPAEHRRACIEAGRC